MNELPNLEIFFESSPDLICIAGFDGYFKKVNASVSHVLGYTMEELLSRPIDSFVHKEDLQQTIQSRKSVIAGTTLKNFDNRYVTKTGQVVWLSWTSIQIQGKELIFGVAKDVTLRKLQEGSEVAIVVRAIKEIANSSLHQQIVNLKAQASNVDQAWLSKFEQIVRIYTGHFDMTISMIGDELAIGERQLFRRVKAILGMTPNKYIRIIRLQLAMEGLKDGKYRTIAETASASGFKTPGYFNALFKEVYGSGISEFI